MKKILFISTTYLLGNDGGALGQRGYLASIKKLSDNNIDVIMPEEGCHGVYSNAIGAPRRSFLKSLLSGSIHRYKSFVSQHLSKNKGVYDICFINGGIYAGDMMDLIHSYGIKIVVTHLNYEPEYQMDNKTMWTFYGRTSFFVRRNERKAYLKSDVNCFMSESDRVLFENNYGKIDTPSVIIGCYEHTSMIAEIESEKTNTDVDIKTPIMAITGSMNTIQTINGIQDFRNNYYNIFKMICPEWRIVIAGRNPSNEIYDFQKENSDTIEVIPNPENMCDIIRIAAVFYCPTNSGGGIKLRLMDGLKMGKPVLVHSVSARGYDSLFEEPFFKKYNDKQSFERGLKDLRDYIETQNDSEMIRQKYLNYFSLEAGTKRYAQVFDLLRK